MPTISVGRQTLHYRLFQGAPRPAHPPLLLVHGAGGNLMHWPGELRRLPEYAVYALDLPGHGKSGGEGRTSIGAYAEVVRGFADALNLPCFVLAGHSMGGGIALEFALRYPGRLAGLVLVSTGARLPVAPEVMTGILTDPVGTADLLTTWTHGGRADPNLLRLYNRRLHEVAPRVFHDDFLACDAFDRTADVERIRIPALIICGDADQMTPVRFSRDLAAQISGAQLVIVPGAGHMVMLEAPGVVTEEVTRFVARVNNEQLKNEQMRRDSPIE